MKKLLMVGILFAGQMSCVSQVTVEGYICNVPSQQDMQQWRKNPIIVKAPIDNSKEQSIQNSELKKRIYGINHLDFIVSQGHPRAMCFKDVKSSSVEEYFGYCNNDNQFLYAGNVFTKNNLIGQSCYSWFANPLQKRTKEIMQHQAAGDSYKKYKGVSYSCQDLIWNPMKSIAVNSITSSLIEQAPVSGFGLFAITSYLSYSFLNEKRITKIQNDNNSRIKRFDLKTLKLYSRSQE